MTAWQILTLLALTLAGLALGIIVLAALGARKLARKMGLRR